MSNRSLSRFHAITGTYYPLCSAQIEYARRADPEPEPDSAAYGLKTLYDGGTAEVEYAMT